ncbi:MAG: hypothetical protein HRS57_00250 [Mycoplasmataceae bacterium]|nr:hypothetical protein [Mycoplasmataceae bacterium]
MHKKLENIYSLDKKMEYYIIIEKHNDFIFSLFMDTNREYYVHIYEKKSSHKGTALWDVANDIINNSIYNVNSPHWENFISNEKNSDTLKGIQIVSIPTFKKYWYTNSQPDITLMSILLNDNAKAYEFVHRGASNTSINGKNYGYTYMEAESEYFKDNPMLRKYSSWQKENSLNDDNSEWISFDKTEDFLNKVTI